MKQEILSAYVAILQEELVLATGCTEPIAIAYAAAKLREVLGKEPERIEAEVSGNTLKNVKSVVVPNTGGLKGIRPAIAAGIVAGRPEAELQVISEVSEEQQGAIKTYSRETPITVACMDDTPCMLDIRLTGRAGADSAVVRIANHHTNVIHIEKNGEVLLDHPLVASAEDNLQDKSVLNLAEILEFADTVPIKEIEPLVMRQIECNTAIAAEGLTGDSHGRLGRRRRLHAARGLAGHPHRGARLGRRGVRRPHERLRDAGRHRLRLRQPGHHGERARCALCQPLRL